MKYTITAIIISLTLNLTAQIHRQYTDKNNHNETIIVKHKAASDATILDELDSYGLGMGDVVRIATEDVHHLNIDKKIESLEVPNMEYATTSLKTALLPDNASTIIEEHPAESTAIKETIKTRSTETSLEKKKLNLSIPRLENSDLATSPSKEVGDKSSQQQIQQSKNTKYLLGWQPSATYLSNRKKQLAARQQASEANNASNNKNVHKRSASNPYEVSNYQRSTNTRSNFANNSTVKKKSKKLLTKRPKKRKRYRNKKWTCFKF